MQCVSEVPIERIFDKYEWVSYAVDYLRSRGLVRAPIFKSPLDWFKYSWILVTRDESVLRFLDDGIGRLIRGGAKPEDIYLEAKWRFWVRALKGNRWRTIAYRDPVVAAGLPYWAGFDQASQNSAYWTCPGANPSTVYQGQLCTTPGLCNSSLMMAFTSSAPKFSGTQADTCGNNMTSVSTSYTYGVGSDGTSAVYTWKASADVTASVSGPYLVLLIDTACGYTCSLYCYGCSGSRPSPSNGCTCGSNYSANTNIEVIYENLGSLSISANTPINMQVQLVISLSSPG